ncbi:MAG: hypothetical protein HY020_09820 [Burkholderiales bacterium]|nr:hypothetical protein [Burkholderiales bacterium]
MPNFKKLCVITALTALTLPAWAELTYTGVGAYNLGSSSGPGGTVAAITDCGSPAGGLSGHDTLEFTGSGINNIGIHAYSCNDSVTNFGSRASGENTYYAQGIASVIGTLGGTDALDFSFFINPGEVGAFGSTAFSAGEFQKSKLTIQLVIDGTTYLDEAWSAEVGTGGAITNSYEHHGTESVGWTSATGAGYFSYGISGGAYSISLLPTTDGSDHTISYVMTSEAAGNVLTTGICTAYLQSNKNQEGVAARVAAEVVAPDGPVTGEAFTSYCGAGARSGDPFPGSDPIARAQAVDLPEPMTAGLALTALLAAAGARRRNDKR